jgi:hypothetical protein
MRRSFSVVFGAAAVGLGMVLIDNRRLFFMA